MKSLKNDFVMGGWMLRATKKETHGSGYHKSATAVVHFDTQTDMDITAYSYGTVLRIVTIKYNAIERE